MVDAHHRQLEALAALLEKAAARKRHTISFTINVPRPLVEAFVSTADISIFPEGSNQGPGSGSLFRATQQFRAANRLRRGRPTLSANALKERVTRKVVGDERHRKRLSRKQRWEAAMDRWFAEIDRRGETILTTDLPPPKF